MIYLGSPVFKIARLLFVAMFSVHLFACIFFRVKISSAFAPGDVTTFYTSKNVAEDVSSDLDLENSVLHALHALLAKFYFLQDLGEQYVSLFFKYFVQMISLCIFHPMSVAVGLLLLRPHDVHNCWLW